MATRNMQMRVNHQVLAQLAADAETLGLGDRCAALREGIALLHRKAEQVRLAESYDTFYGGRAAPISDAMAALLGIEE